jgi:hypothetical protein
MDRPGGVIRASAVLRPVQTVFSDQVISAVLLAIVGDSSTDNSFSDCSFIGFIGS